MAGGQPVNGTCQRRARHPVPRGDTAGSGDGYPTAPHPVEQTRRGREEEQLPRLQFDCVPPRAAFCCWFSAAAGGEPGSDPAEPSPGLCQGARTRLRRLSSHGFWGARVTHGTRQPGQAGAFLPKIVPCENKHQNELTLQIRGVVPSPQRDEGRIFPTTIVRGDRDRSEPPSPFFPLQTTPAAKDGLHMCSEPAPVDALLVTMATARFLSPCPCHSP